MKKFWKKNSFDLTVRFVSTVSGLSKIEEVQPKPAKFFMPKWWDETSNVFHKPQISFSNDDLITVKRCPSFPEYFNQGFIVPMWADTIVAYDKATNTWGWRTVNSKFTIDIHPNSQFIEPASPNFLGKNGYFVFKLVSPWKLLTPKGYSVYQLPLYFHFNKDFSVVPGIMRTDSLIHDVNPHIILHTTQKEVLIKRGTPLVQYVPFKRNVPFKLEVIENNAQLEEKFFKIDSSITTKFSGSGVYARMRKLQDLQEQQERNRGKNE